MKPRKILRDLHGSFFGTENQALELQSLLGISYPLDWQFMLDDQQFYFAPKDTDGIPLTTDTGGKPTYFPTRVASYALAHFNRYVKFNDAISRNLFLRAAAWFMAAHDGVWPYHCDYAFTSATLKSPWLSAMAQGQGISVLTRAHRLTGDDQFLLRARQATVPLLLTIDDGGVRSRIDGRWDFLEEYPLPEPRHTLNGFLFALIGLLDLAASLKKKRSRSAWRP